MSKLAFLFPGQGSQFVGMGKDLAQSHSLFHETIEEAEDLLRLPIKKAMFEGPSSLLLRADICQIAVFSMSVALVRVLEEKFPSLLPDYCAGLSVGEYSALYASKMAHFSDLLELVACRAQLMQSACAEEKSTMAAVMGGSLEVVQELIGQSGVEVFIANYNAPTQIVIGGAPNAVAQFSKFVRSAKRMKCIPLEVDGAFHTRFMQKAAEKLAPYIDTLSLSVGQSTLIANVTGKAVSADAEESNMFLLDRYRQDLAQHMCTAVQWAPSIELMKHERVKLFVEIGCGSVLSSLNRRNGVKFPTLAIHNTETLDQVLKQLEPYAKERLYGGY